ncbi:MAG: M50 family metallopeptidase [Candidatus Eremiobacteraeota bacterium]|nr:M50 family metallopeptidase [Candidatus Eremiobacteraeota bacterium]
MFEIILISVTIASILAVAGKIAIFLALLSLLVVFHEFGHFVFAKRAGVTVTDFAVGFGPSLVAVRRGDTTYRLNMLPLGGYCKMAGEDVADDGSSDPGNFQRKSIGARFAIIAAGPIFNLVLAVVIFAGIAGINGIETGATNVVRTVNAGTPAERAGLTPGDKIVALDGVPVRSGDEMVGYIHQHPGKVIAVDVERSRRLLHLHIRAEPVTVGGQRIGQFGFLPQFAVEHKPLLADVVYGVNMVGATIVQNFVGLGDAIRRHDASAVHGPVGIARVVVSAEAMGPIVVVQLTAVLSTVLGVINLLPFPALDGGRLAFLLVELVRGRPVDPEKEGLVHLTGFALLMILVIFVTYHDIMQWVAGKGVL